MSADEQFQGRGGKMERKRKDRESQNKENRLRERRERKDKSEKKRRKYSRPGCLVWAVRKLWRLDGWFMFFLFATVPPRLLSPLLDGYFPKELIDRIGAGANFRELATLSLGFMLARVLLSQLKSFIDSRCRARWYYPTSVYQSEMSAWENYETDYENTLKQDYKEISGYAWRDATWGRCALEFFAEDLFHCLFHLTGIVAYASLLTMLNPILLAAVALLSATSYFTARWRTVYYEKNKSKWEKESRKEDYLKGLSQNFSLAKDIKLYGLEGWLDGMMRDYQAYILMWNKRCSLRGLWAGLLSGLMTMVQNGAAYFFLIGTLLGGDITVGEFVFYFNLLVTLGGFFQDIIGDVAKLNTFGEKIGYYRNFFDYPNKFNHGKGCELPRGPVSIELKDVWYRYDGAGKDTLKGINLLIEGGENLALVGMNGAGKTTLIKLICGMLAPARGEILVNGKRIEEINIEEYYSLISAVFQDIHAIAFTLFEFVASADLERPTAREDAASAMRAAGIYEKIQSLPHGMDTHLMRGIYDDGVDLSGGEMQKLVLARAIYKDSAILVLDEPTAALDPIAENNLYLRYKELTRGKTSIYISHRFASTRFCDRIVLLEDGRIREMGTHEQLMEKNGRYAYMFGVQSKYYMSDEESDSPTEARYDNGSAI